MQFLQIQTIKFLSVAFSSIYVLYSQILELLSVPNLNFKCAALPASMLSGYHGFCLATLSRF